MDDLRAQQFFGAASPGTFFVLAACLIVLAALVGRLAPRKKKRIRRATILLACYGTSFIAAVLLRAVHAEGWSHRVWYAADLFEVLAVIDMVALFLFDVVLLALRIELADIVHDLARGGAYLLAVFAILHRSGMDFSGLVATSAVVTVVLGLSLQATLGNVLGGVALQLDDSLHAGDWVQLQNGIQGRIKAIRWRHTVLETRNWDTVIVPNSSLLAEEITLLGQREEQPVQHRMWVWFHVDYRFAPDEVIRIVDEALQSAPIPNAATEPRPHAVCMDLAKEGTSGVASYAVRYWLRELAKDDPTSSEVRCRLYAALKRAGIPLALPGQAVFVSQDDPEHDARKESRETGNRVAALAQLELFRGLDQDERLELSRAMRFAPFGRGEVITRQGSPARFLYVLAKGRVEVRIQLDKGSEEPGRPAPGGGRTDAASNDKLVTTLDAPEVFGELGMMTGETRSASVVAASEVDCYRLDRDGFQQLLSRRPDLAENISSVMAKREVALAAVRENLDAQQRARRVSAEKSRMLHSIQDFFGLKDES